MTSWTGRTVIETGRLILRAFREDDLPLYCQLGQDPVVMRYLGGLWTAERTQEAAAHANRSLDENGYGFLAIEHRADGVFLGIGGLSVEQWYPDDLQVGWRLFQHHWGQGYATEAGLAWRDHAFESLGQKRLISMADTPNLKSQAVMQRLGMRYDHEARLRDGDDEFDATIYAMGEADWRATRI
jgi:RimJ/RimL family protein N-acetyltransferase